MKNRRNLVFSTAEEWQPEEQEKLQRVPSTKQGALYLLRDRKGRGGKTVTVIEGYNGDSKAMLKKLQKLCGSGGAVKNGNLEIQGDHRDKVGEFLKQDGFTIKFKGG